MLFLFHKSIKEKANRKNNISVFKLNSRACDRSNETDNICVFYCFFLFSQKKGGEIRNNIEVRIAIIEAELKHYQVAKKLRIHKYSLSRKLRYELSEKEKDRILKAIEELKKENQ